MIRTIPFSNLNQGAHQLRRSAGIRKILSYFIFSGV
jgi:hypothetical protein